jgi:hypothetical protein
MLIERNVMLGLIALIVIGLLALGAEIFLR